MKRTRRMLNLLVCGIVVMTILTMAIPGPSLAQGGVDVQIDPDITSVVQNEISLTLLPGTQPGVPALLLAAYNDNPFANGLGIGYSYSTDGGVSWTDGQLPFPLNPYSGLNMVDAFDPTAASDTQGNVYIGQVSTDAIWATGPATGLFVHKSTTGGVSWLPPVAVSTNPGATGSPDANYRLNDRCQMTVDKITASSYTDRIYISWIKDRGWNMPQPNSDIYFAYSNNYGTTFNLATGTGPGFAGRINDAGVGHDLGNMPVPAVAADGTVYTSWMDYNVQTGGIGTIYLDKSTDGGATWGTDMFVRTVNLPPLYLNGNTDVRAKGAPVLKTSPTNANELYIMFAEDPDGPGSDECDIFLIKSTNAGLTWSAPVRVNDDSTLNDQILPWMDVKPDGTIDAAWYDRRNDPIDLLWDVYFARSTDGGATFSANVKLSDNNFATPNTPVGKWFGEYLGLVVDTTHAYVVFTSSLTDTDGDVYFDKIANRAGPPTTIIDIDPDVLNMMGKGKWITGYIELPAGLDVNNIDITTVTISDIDGISMNIPAAGRPTSVGDYDNDGVPDLMVKFVRNAVTGAGFAAGNHQLTISGSLAGGQTFNGSDTIRFK